MAKKGELSKSKLTQDILKLYQGSSFVQDKNIYINFKEDGELVQLKIAITAPKTPVGTAEIPIQKDFDWSDTPSSSPESTEIPKEELDTVKQMLERLGL